MMVVVVLLRTDMVLASTPFEGIDQPLARGFDLVPCHTIYILNDDM